jgi:hypothetical protein
MAYVPVPKDLTTVKTRVLFNLTKRQFICFGGGALIGIPLLFAQGTCGSEYRSRSAFRGTGWSLKARSFLVLYFDGSVNGHPQ